MEKVVESERAIVYFKSIWITIYALNLRRYRMWHELWLLIRCAGFILGAAYAEEPRMYLCYRAAGPVVVDGKLSEPTWKRAPWTELFVDIEGEKRPPPRYATRAMMAWDEKNFYVAAELEEPDVWGFLTERDVMIYEDPDFEVFIWPCDGKKWPDERTPYYYEFEINALNIVMDALLKRLGGKGSNKREFHKDWDFKGIKHAVQIFGTLNWPEDVDEGWTVEVAFPWDALREYAGGRRVPPGEGDVWRVNFSRVERERGSADIECENWVWSPQGAVEMHIPDRWGYVKFTYVVAGGR